MVSLTSSTVIGRCGPVTFCSAQSVWCVWRTLWVRSCWWVCPVATRSTSSALWCGWQQADTAALCVAGPATRRNSREVHRAALLKTLCRTDKRSDWALLILMAPLYSHCSQAQSSLCLSSSQVACGKFGTRETWRHYEWMWYGLMLSWIIDHLVSIPIEGYVLTIMADQWNYERPVTIVSVWRGYRFTH